MRCTCSRCLRRAGRSGGSGTKECEPFQSKEREPFRRAAAEACMKRVLAAIVCGAVSSYVASGFSRTFAFSRTVSEPPRVSRADVDRWMTELSNWGRWGKTDQIGTLNLVTAEKRKQALTLARDGVSVSLAHTLEKEQLPDNPRPIGQQMTLDTGGHAMDLYTIWYHGSTITHIDSLCHYSFDGKIYNGYLRSEIAQGPGCPSNGIEHQKNGIMTRGIIVDLRFAAPDSPARDRRARPAARGRDGSRGGCRNRRAAEALGVPRHRRG